MSARQPRRWWVPVTVQVLAGNTATFDIRKGRNISLEGFGGGTTADVDLHAHVLAIRHDGTAEPILPSDNLMATLNPATTVPSQANYEIYRTEFWTHAIDVCDIDYLQIFLRNNGASDTYFVGHIRGSSWG